MTPKIFVTERTATGVNDPAERGVRGEWIPPEEYNKSIILNEIAGPALKGSHKTL